MPNHVVSEGISMNVIFNRAILDEAVRLGKCGKETNCLAAEMTKEAPDEDEQRTKTHPAQISAIIAQGPKCFCAATMRTPFWWPHPFVETFGDILFGININGVDQLHHQLRLPLRISIRSYLLPREKRFTPVLMVRASLSHNKPKSRGLSRVA
jgi:hypothetical protein